MENQNLRFNQQIAANLRRMMELRKVSPEDIAEKTGLHIATIQRYIETERPRQPRLSLFLRVCKVLDVTPNELLGFSPISLNELSLPKPYLKPLTRSKKRKRKMASSKSFSAPVETPSNNDDELPWD